MFSPPFSWNEIILFRVCERAVSPVGMSVVGTVMPRSTSLPGCLPPTKGNRSMGNGTVAV
jgi:hypothetical protein